jgi:hypothetical protein
MKKFFALLLTTALLMTLFSSCTSPESSSTPPQLPDPEPIQEETILDPAQEGTDDVTSASPKESSNPDDIIKGLSDAGFWIFAILSDVTLDEELIVSGEFYDKDDPNENIYRKLSLYAQDDERNITANYTLTVPRIVVMSPNFRIQNGMVKGDVYVDADGFELMNTVLEGSLTFKTQAQMDSAKLDEGTINGTVSVE